MAGRIKICPYCHTENDANNVSCEECDSDLSRVKSIKKEDSGSAGVNLSDKEADSASAPREKRDVKPLPDTDNAPLAEATVQPPQVTSDSSREEKAVVMEAVTSSQEAKNTSYPETDNAKTSAPAISPYDSHGRLLYSKECPFCHHINRGVAKICAGCGENIKRIKPVLPPYLKLPQNGKQHRLKTRYLRKSLHQRIKRGNQRQLSSTLHPLRKTLPVHQMFFQHRFRSRSLLFRNR